MSFITDLLKKSMENDQIIKVITEEGYSSYITEGVVKGFNEEEVLIEKTNKKTTLIKISKIIKIEN